MYIHGWNENIAEFAYDALGRRIEKKDLIDPSNTRRYYYNYKWQVLVEYDGEGFVKGWFVYGNYIDEVLAMGTTPFPVSMLYIHDHLYSPAVLTNFWGTVLERYEYDAYGNCYVLEPNFAPDPDGQSDYGNPFYFQGKHLDLLDNGSLELMSWPYRNYSTYLGRWYQPDKLGMIPNDNKEINQFDVLEQYKDGLNLYNYVKSNPTNYTDPMGLKKRCPCNSCDVWKFGGGIGGGGIVEIGGGYIFGFLRLSATLQPIGDCCFDKKELKSARDYVYWGFGGALGLPVSFSGDLTNSKRLETECVKWSDWRGYGSVVSMGAGYGYGVSLLGIETPVVQFQMFTVFDCDDVIGGTIDLSALLTLGYWRFPN